MSLDLSHQDFIERRDKVSNYSRGGYYKAKPVQDAEKSDVDKPPARTSQRQGTYEGNDVEIEDEDMHDGEGADEDSPRLRRDKGKRVDRGSPARDQVEGDEEAEESLEDIQILDLHSPHPLISYRGRIFEGDWAEMIGTELILTQRDDGNETSHPPLPALRNLEDGIDLLAASASKILTREKILKPLIGNEEAERKQALEEVKKEWNIRIPLGKKDKEGEKGEQARFLENLMALKKKKGETDNVTVYARPAGEERREPSFRKPRGEDIARERTPSRRRAKKTGPRWNRGGMGLLGMRGDDGAGGDEGEEGRSLSTPTPLKWGDLMTPRSEAAARQRKGGDGDEDVQMSG